MRRVRRLASLVVATCALIVSVRDAGAQKAPRSDPQVNRTSWGAVVGRVYTASDGAPIVGARVTVRNDRMFADKGPTCGVTDETGKYAVQAPLGRVSENFDIGRALNSGIAGLLLGGATNRTKRVDVTRLDMRIEATGYRSYAGPVNCRRSEPERFSVTMEPVLMTPAGEREVSAPADGWGAAYVLAVTVEPEVALGGEDVTVRARVRLPLALPRRDVVVLCTSSTLGRRRMETVVSQADGVAVLEMKARAPRPRRSVLDTVTAAIERCPVDVSAGADVGTATYQVISTESDRANAVLRAEALSAEASQDYAVAAARWKAVCAAQEASPDDYRRLAEAASRVHDHGTAAQALAKAVEVAPERDRPDAMGLHAAALVRAGDPAGVVSAYGPMHGSRPAKDRRLRLSPLLLSALGESYVLTGRLDEARAVRDDLHALEGRLPDAAIRFRNGLRLAEAARAASEKDRDAAAKAAYGRALVDLERFEEAAAPLRQATQLDPLLMAPTADLAFAYDRLAPTPRAGVKDLDAAIAAAELDAWIGEGRKAAKSKDFIAWHRLATLLCRSLLGSGPPRTFSDERTTRAIAALEDAVRTARSGARVNEGVFAGPFGYASARVVAVAGFAYPEAAWDYVTMESLRSLRADASDEYALLNLASALVETGEAGPASVLLPDLARMRSGDPEVTFLRARVAIADDDLDSAEKLLREVLVANPRHPEAHRHLARILAERGDWSGAGATLAARSAVYGPDVRSDGGGDGL